MTIPNAIVSAGSTNYPFDHAVNYEKTTDDNEIIAGRILSFGTAVTQLKLQLANKPGVAVGLKQTHRPGQDSDDNYDENYARDGKSCVHAAWGPFLFKGCLDDGQTIVNGDPLEAEIGTGKLTAQISGHRTAVAFESSSPSGADNDDFLAMFLGLSSERWIEETLTVTTNVATLTYVPTMVEYVEVIAGTATGGCSIGTTVTEPLEGSCYLNRSGKQVTFSTTDAATSCKIRYQF